MPASQYPELDRDDVMELLNSTEHGLDEETYTNITASVRGYTVSDSPETLQREYEQACIGRDNPTDSRAIRAGLKCFTSPRLRDPLIAALLERPQEGFVFVQQLMHTVPLDWPSMRSQITAMLALLAHATKQSDLASNAARHAVRIDDTVSLSRMIAQLTALGKTKELVDSAYKGATQAHAELFCTDTDAA